MIRLRLTVFSWVLLLWATTATAGTVAIVRPPTPTPDSTETVSRIHGELLSVGLEVKMIGRPANRSPDRLDWRAWLESIATLGGLDAVINVVGSRAPLTVDIWVFEKSPRRFQVFRVTPEPKTSTASERLAIRTIEVLRSTFLEKDMVASVRPVEPMAVPSLSSPGPQPEAPTPHTPHFGFELGGGANTSLEGVGPALAPLVRFNWAWHPSLVAQLTLSGLGTGSRVESGAGNAQVAQEYGLLGGCYRVGPDQWIWPYVALSAGLMHSGVEGHAPPPRVGHALERWSFLLEGSLGAGLQIPDRYSLTLGAHVQVADPYVAVHVADKVVATTGRPNLALTLALGVWL